MRKTFIFVLLLSASLLGWATDILTPEQIRLKTEEFDRPSMLDTVDQRDLPRHCTWGLFFNGNMSNFIMTENRHTTSSEMRVGFDVGVLAEFWIVKHFLIQPQVSFSAEVNKFGIGHEYTDMWSFGLNIPVYFLGQFGNLQNGYIRFGAGPYTHFTFATSFRPDNYEFDPFNAGLAAMVGYEFPCGVQLNAQYMISMSDVVTYYKHHPQDHSQPLSSRTTICPQHVSLGVAYRFRNNRSEQRRNEMQARYGANHEERLLNREPDSEYDVHLKRR